MPPINPILAWSFFLGSMAAWAVLHWIACDIEVNYQAGERKPVPDRKARIADAPYNIIMAAAEHQRMEDR